MGRRSTRIANALAGAGMGYILGKELERRGGKDKAAAPATESKKMAPAVEPGNQTYEPDTAPRRVAPADAMAAGAVRVPEPSMLATPDPVAAPATRSITRPATPVVAAPLPDTETMPSRHAAPVTSYPSVQAFLADRAPAPAAAPAIQPSLVQAQSNPLDRIRRNKALAQARDQAAAAVLNPNPYGMGRAKYADGGKVASGGSPRTFAKKGK